MKNQILIFLSGILLGIFLATQFISGCNKQPCPDLTTHSDTNIVSTIDTTKTVVKDTNTTIVDGHTTYNNKTTVVIKPMAQTLALKDTTENIYTFVQTLNECDDNGDLKGTLSIKTYGYNLEGWDLDWNYTKQEINTTESVIITRKDSTTINNTTAVAEKKHILLLLGSSIGFDKTSLRDVNFNASIQLKSSKIIYYEVSQSFIEGSTLTHRVGFKMPIRLKSN